jgi:preprotein translocase subunit YajC
MSLLIFPLIIFGLYFLMLRPQQQRMRRQQELVKSIGVGDRVLTASGLIGRVVDESGDRLLLEIADGVVVEFVRLAVSRRLDESEPSFLSLSDEAELDGGYEEDESEEEPAAGESSIPESSAGESSAVNDEAAAGEALPVEAVEPDVAPTAPISAEHVTGAPASPGAGAVNPEGTTPGTAAPVPGQDPH